MKPDISVLTPTCSSQFLPEQVKALEAQSFKNFEWVLVDDLWEQTKGFKANLCVTHIPPKDIKPYPAIASACNDGLVYARGKLIFFMNNYVLPHPDCLARHWEIYQKYPEAMISGRGIQTVVDPKQLGILSGNQNAADYRMWLFNTFYKQEKLEDDLYEVFREGIQNWWAGRNDSAPFKAILDCNGFDETFDGRWGGQDADLAQRLMTYGLRYLLDKQSLCLEFNHIHGVKVAIRTEQEQQAFQYSRIDAKREAGIFTSGITRNLKKERKVGENRILT